MFFFPSLTDRGTGDEFEIVLATNADGLDIIMTVRLEHENTKRPTRFGPCRGGNPHPLRVQVAVEVLARATLPKTEFKAKRVRDERQK
jgi:phenylacetate-coenzyme A ligase PaaK-like adenylate-forming protein